MFNQMRYRVAGIMILAVVPWLLTGCIKKKSKEALNSKETLRVTLNSEPPSLDWVKATDSVSSQVLVNVMDGLVTYDYYDPNLKLLPALATKWEPSQGARVWTFTLRQGVKWTDGKEFKGQQVIDAWERLLNPKTAAKYAYYLHPIKNAKKYSSGELKDFSQVGAHMNEQGQLVVELEAPQSYFPYLLTYNSTYPIRKDVIAKYGDQWTEPQNIQTLGAYRLKTWEHDKQIILERNDTYYGEKPKIKNVVAYIISEFSTALNLFHGGKLDVQTELPMTEVGVLKKMKEYKEKSLLVLYYYGFNVRKPPMNNPYFRKAISYAVDRRQITGMLGGGKRPTAGWVPPGMFGYEKNRGIHFDVAKAKGFLKKAGYKSPKEVPKLIVGFNTNENHQRIAENLQAQLKKNLGISVELRNEEWKVYLDTLKVDPPHIFRMGWVADYPDPDTFMALMTTDSTQNYSKWSNKKFDHIVRKAASVVDPSERKELYSEAQQILTETEVPVLPVYADVENLLVSSRVNHFPYNSVGLYPYKGVEIQ